MGCVEGGKGVYLGMDDEQAASFRADLDQLDLEECDEATAPQKQILGKRQGATKCIHCGGNENDGKICPKTNEPHRSRGAPSRARPRDLSPPLPHRGSL